MTTTPNTTASGAANAGLHALADRIEEAQGRAICISVESADYLREALAASAPVAPTMVDMVPPATSRDRWMYEQGRLAERDPRTSRAAPVAPAPQPAGAGEQSLRNAFGVWAETQGNGEVSLLDVLSPIEAEAAFDNWKLTLVAAAPKAAPAELPDAVAHYGGVFTDEQLGMKPAPRQQGEYLPLPVPLYAKGDCDGYINRDGYSADDMRSYVDAHLAARGAAQAAPAEPDMRSVALAAGAYTTAYSMLTHAKVHNADVDGSTKRLVAAINGLRSALGPSAPVDKASTPDGTPCNVELRGLWYGAGGSFHGPTLESATMPEALLLPFLRSLLSAPVAEDAEIRKALDDAATALETIGRIAGRDQYMLGMMDVRLYAAARAKVAREALAAQPEGGAK